MRKGLYIRREDNTEKELHGSETLLKKTRQKRHNTEKGLHK